MIKRSGQSTLEYIIMVVIIIAALVTMQTYVKRGLSGRWQSAVDDIGDQYDPRLTNGRIRHSINSQSNTAMIFTYGNMGVTNGYYSMRIDKAIANETKTGSVQVGN